MFKRLLPFLFLSFFFVLSVDSYAYSHDKEITEFIVDIVINEDSSIDVVERILMDFGDNQNHGIIRLIPFAYGENAEYRELEIVFIDVTDENGVPYKYAEYDEYYSHNLKIGDGDIYVTGQNWYYISYHVDNVINGFESHDELYWNVTGNEWDFPIKSVHASVVLPEGAKLANEYLTCYTGFYGSSSQNCDYINFYSNH